MSVSTGQALPIPIRLNGLDRLAMRVLERLARGHDQCWSATSTLASKLGVGVRAAQYRLARLVRLGLIEVVRDSALRTGRRIVLLWRREGPSIPPRDATLATTYVDSEAQTFAPPQAQTFAPGAVPPLDPPIEESEDNTTRESADDEEVATVSESTQVSERPPAVEAGLAPAPAAQVDRSGETRRATQDELDRVRALAARVAPADPSFADWTLGQARQHGLRWVAAALRDAAAKAAKQTVRNPRGLVLAILATLKREHRQPPDLPAPAPAAPTESMSARWAREEAERAEQARQAKAKQQAQWKADLEEKNALFRRLYGTPSHGGR
ncbi:MAG: hypothetical protein VW239_00545 [Candidatus Nanopelagicales bacterium]